MVKTAKIPSDKSSWGSFNQLREDTDNNSMNILKEILKSKYPAGSEGQKIQALYTTYTDWTKRNALGISPIKADLDKVDAIKDLKVSSNILIRQHLQVIIHSMDGELVLI